MKGCKRCKRCGKLVGLEGFRKSGLFYSRTCRTCEAEPFSQEEADATKKKRLLKLIFISGIIAGLALVPVLEFVENLVIKWGSFAAIGWYLCWAGHFIVKNDCGEK